MKIKTVNFEMILERYQPYADGIQKLESYKSDFNKKVESIKSEMEQIVSSSRVLVLDQTTKEKNAMRVRELQAEGMRLEAEFRSSITDTQNRILEDCFGEIRKIVDDWAKLEGIDLVLNSNSYIWANEELDITADIMGVIIEKGLNIQDEKILN